MHASTRVVMDRRIRTQLRWSDRHPQCDVSLCCQQELCTQGFFGVPTGKDPEDSNLTWNVEAMQWVLFYVSIGNDACY
jgi:hypothetical protein